MDFVGFNVAIISLDAKLLDVTAGRVHIEQTQNSIDPPFIQLFICKNNKRKENIQYKYWEVELNNTGFVDIVQLILTWPIIAVEIYTVFRQNAKIIKPLGDLRCSKHNFVIIL